MGVAHDRADRLFDPSGLVSYSLSQPTRGDLRRRVSAIVSEDSFREDEGDMKRLFVFLAGGCLALPVPARSQTEEWPVIRRSFATVETPVPAFSGGVFDPRPGETISFLGGTDIHEWDRHPDLELAFHLAWPDRGLHLRNLAWQGDTIYYQARPRFFYTRAGDPQPGSIPDHRERTQPGIVFLGFGKMESLEGSERLAAFVKAYGDALDLLRPLTGRIVLVTPAPFFATGPASSLAAKRNETLSAYTEAIRMLAAERGLLVVDLFGPLSEKADPAWTTNGVHLSAAGQREATAQIASQLQFPVIPGAATDSSVVQSLRQAVGRKNQLWWQYYRPSNWAFLFGDRQHVPASRDPEDRDQRWFVREIDSLPGLIAETEADIHRYARAARSDAKAQPVTVP